MKIKLMDILCVIAIIFLTILLWTVGTRNNWKTHGLMQKEKCESIGGVLFENGLGYSCIFPPKD